MNYLNIKSFTVINYFMNLIINKVTDVAFVMKFNYYESNLLEQKYCFIYYYIDYYSMINFIFVKEFTRYYY